jgi:hypothetical protein
MTTMRDLKRLLEGGPDPAAPPRPDLVAIVRQGRRLRRRRRVGAGTVAAACCLALAVPVGVQVGVDVNGGSSPPASTPDRTPGQRAPQHRAEPPCGEWLCLDSRQVARPLGAVVDTGDRVAGVPVLLFAERHRQLDPETGDLVRTPTLVVGYRDPETDQLLVAGWAGVPRHPFPQQLPLPLDYSSGGGPWVVVGSLTQPNAADVTAALADGTPVEVHRSGQEVAPGIRVFWASGSQPERMVQRMEFRVLDASGGTLAACEIRHCGGTG